jgi:hypothetical protein
MHCIILSKCMYLNGKFKYLLIYRIYQMIINAKQKKITKNKEEQNGKGREDEAELNQVLP